MEALATEELERPNACEGSTTTDDPPTPWPQGFCCCTICFCPTKCILCDCGPVSSLLTLPPEDPSLPEKGWGRVEDDEPRGKGATPPPSHACRPPRFVFSSVFDLVPPLFSLQGAMKNRPPRVALG